MQKAIALAAAKDYYRWKRVADVDEVSITVSVVTRAELERLSDVGRRGRGCSVIRCDVKGYAQLRRNVETGEYVCSVYVRSATDQKTIDHETRHCYGWAHQ